MAAKGKVTQKKNVDDNDGVVIAKRRLRECVFHIHDLTGVVLKVTCTFDDESTTECSKGWSHEWMHDLVYAILASLIHERFGGDSAPIEEVAAAVRLRKNFAAGQPPRWAMELLNSKDGSGWDQFFSLAQDHSLLVFKETMKNKIRFVDQAAKPIPAKTLRSLARRLALSARVIEHLSSEYRDCLNRQPHFIHWLAQKIISDTYDVLSSLQYVRMTPGAHDYREAVERDFDVHAGEPGWTELADCGPKGTEAGEWQQYFHSFCERAKGRYDIERQGEFATEESRIRLVRVFTVQNSATTGWFKEHLQYRKYGVLPLQLAEDARDELDSQYADLTAQLDRGFGFVIRLHPAHDPLVVLHAGPDDEFAYIRTDQPAVTRRVIEVFRSLAQNTVEYRSDSAVRAAVEGLIASAIDPVLMRLKRR